MDYLAHENSLSLKAHRRKAPRFELQGLFRKDKRNRILSRLLLLKHNTFECIFARVIVHPCALPT